MRRSALLWILFYILVVSAPLIGGVINLGHGRGFWLNFSIALGFVSLSIMGAQFVMVSRMRVVSQPIGMDSILEFHRLMAYMATIFALVHPLILFAKDEKYWPLLNVFTSPPRAKFAVASVVALLALMVLSMYRRRFGVSYRMWKITHWLLAFVVIVAAMAHAILVNYYLKDRWEQIIWLALTVVFVGLGVWVRGVKPLLRIRRRWRVKSIHHETAGTTTLALELVNPQSYGKDGFQFKAGQFAWLTARRSPFSLTYNPFSISSSAEQRDCINFTIKAHDGFSAEVAKLQVGETVYVDGPHGSFFLDAETQQPLVLIGAGVGVTPLVSMLHTLADRGIQRPCHLWLANKDRASIICHEQIAALEKRLALKIAHVFSNPGSDSGDSPGRLDTDFILRHLPETPHLATYFICGSAGLMNMAEATLMRAGVPRHKIHSERFSMV